MPPEDYWTSAYQDAAGHEMINEWYAGFNEGAFAASQDGVGQLAELATWVGGQCCDEKGRIMARTEPGPRKPRRGDPPVRAKLPPPSPKIDLPKNSEGAKERPIDPLIETPLPSEPEKMDRVPVDPAAPDPKKAPKEPGADKDSPRKDNVRRPCAGLRTPVVERKTQRTSPPTAERKMEKASPPIVEPKAEKLATAARRTKAGKPHSDDAALRSLDETCAAEIGASDGCEVIRRAQQVHFGIRDGDDEKRDVDAAPARIPDPGESKLPAEGASEIPDRASAASVGGHEGAAATRRVPTANDGNDRDSRFRTAAAGTRADAGATRGEIVAGRR